MCLLSQKTELLLLDEPFTHLDERACSFIMDWIEENKKVAKDVGSIAGNARREIEMKTGKPVITSKNAIDFSRLISDIIKSVEEDEKNNE